jgi:hypothetical protein
MEADPEPFGHIADELLPQSFWSVLPQKWVSHWRGMGAKQ